MTRTAWEIAALVAIVASLLAYVGTAPLRFTHCDEARRVMIADSILLAGCPQVRP